MKYVDGYVIPILKKNLKTYKQMATMGATIWLKMGALDYKECVGEDLKTKWGMPFSAKPIHIYRARLLRQTGMQIHAK